MPGGSQELQASSGLSFAVAEEVPNLRKTLVPGFVHEDSHSIPLRPALNAISWLDVVVAVT